MEILLLYFVVIVGNLGSAGVKADINCGPPPVIERAIIIAGANKEVYRPESLLLYKCRLGYFSDVSVVSSKCKLSKDNNLAKWTKPNIRCKKVTCEVPGSPKNGRAIYSSIDFQAEVKYECNEGYYLSNQERRFCSADGTWNGTDPVCSDNLCSFPRAPENGFFNLISVKPDVGSIVRYSCKDGFRLEGSATSECNEMRRWTNSIPRCSLLPKMCELPVAPENGFFRLTPDKPEAGSIVRYSCRNGFRLHGSETSECNEEGTWTNPTPRCFFITDSCKVPEILPHGEIGMYKVVPHPQYIYFLKYESISAGTIVADGQFVLKCDEMYKPKGTEGQEKRIECVDGTWLDDLQCVSENSCELPIKPENGFYHAPKKPTFGSIIKYYCKIGFRLQGSTESVCRTTGRWSSPTPICLTISCVFPVAPENGFFNLTSDKLMFGSTVKFYCKEGFRLEGSAISECNRMGRWSNPMPRCLTHRKLFEQEDNKTTTTQPSIRSSINENGTKPDNGLPLCFCEYNSPDRHLVAYCENKLLLNGDKVKFNCTVKFYCVTATYYRRTGPREMTCTNCQPFRSTEYPKCIERNLREPCSMESLYSRLPEGVILSMGERQPATVPHGTTLELTCADYNRTMQISHYRYMPIAMCVGPWILRPIRCVCRLSLRANSSLIAVPKKDLYFIGETVTFSCPEGQTITSDLHKIYCSIRGWSEEPIPDCRDQSIRQHV